VLGRVRLVRRPSGWSCRIGAGAGRERGSVLALVPAGFLVLLILGALAVDDGAAYLGQRQLQANLQAAATDAAGAAVANGAFYGGGGVEVAPTQAATVVCQDLAAQGPSGLLDTAVSLAVVGSAVFVQGHAEVAAVFGSRVPGFARRAVSAEAVAVAEQGATTVAPTAPPAGAFAPLACG
jgi:hypothetical protein